MTNTRNHSSSLLFQKEKIKKMKMIKEEEEEEEEEWRLGGRSKKCQVRKYWEVLWTAVLVDLLPLAAAGAEQKVDTGGAGASE